MSVSDKKSNPPSEFVIHPLGSLGLLAVGDIGLRKWREVRDAALRETRKKKRDKKK